MSYFAENYWHENYWHANYWALTPTVNQPPVINNQSFDSTTGLIAGSEIGTVVATDPDDDPIQYTIIAGNTGNDIALDINTGALTWANVPDIDRTSTYSLTVQASDGALTDTATVTINVLERTEGAILLVGPNHIIGQQDHTSLSKGDVERIEYDLTRRLKGAGASITSATWSSTPEGITFSDQAETTYTVAVDADTSSAVSNRTYIINCKYTDSNGNIKTIKAKLRVLGTGEFK